MDSVKTIIPALFFSVIFSLSFNPTRAAAVSNKCNQVFLDTAEKNQEPPNPTLWQKAKQYRIDVVESRGTRLFLKNSETDKDQTKWYGFLSKQRLDINKTGIKKYLSAIANYIPRRLGRLFSRDVGYEFTPFLGLYNFTLRMPVQYLTAKYSNKRMEPAFFFKFPLIIALSTGASLGVDAIYQNRLQSHINYEVKQNATAYDRVIQSDYRYQKIKLSLEKGEISAEEAQREAYLISLAYSQYFQFRDSSDSTPNLQAEMALLDHYLFTHLKNVILNGVPKSNQNDGFYTPESALGQLSDAQKLELFSNNHQRYLKYQIIAEMVGQTALWEQIRNSPNMYTVVDAITNDPFTKQLYDLRDSGRITNFQLQSYLQEDAYWQNRFQDWNTIGVIRLKKVGETYLNQALTLSDIREEVLVEIAKNSH